MKTSTPSNSNHTGETSRKDIHLRVTERIVADLEKGVRPWVKPWNVEHTAGKITRPLRHNGTPYSGINILMLWSAAVDGGYAEEELVAELGAAFLCADLELALHPREDHAAYIAHWLKVLQNDKRAIFRAAAHAQRAADHLHKLQPSIDEAA